MTTRNRQSRRRYAQTWAYPLWKLMHDEHGLLLLESELQEIVDIVRAMKPDGDLKPRRKPMTNKEKVLRKFPSARCVKALGCYYIGYIRATDGGPTFSGAGNTAASAWADAAGGMK